MTILLHKPYLVKVTTKGAHRSLDLKVRGCVKFGSILMWNVLKIGVSSFFEVLRNMKQKLFFWPKISCVKSFYWKLVRLTAKGDGHRSLFAPRRGALFYGKTYVENSDSGDFLDTLSMNLKGHISRSWQFFKSNLSKFEIFRFFWI